MKRFILFPLLILVAAACQDIIPTAPIPGADFAKGGGGKPDCTVDPSHPKCKDGGDDEIAYTTTDLGTIGGRKSTSAATDISDADFEGTRRVSGSSTTGRDLYENSVPVRWEVSAGGDVEGPHTLPLGSFSEGVARGISDDGRIIVGYAGNMPVRWDGDSWAMTELAPVEGYEYGLAFDANNDGIAAGWSTGESQTPVRVATLWDGSASPVSLPNPIASDGVSKAKAVNSDGHLAGEVWDAAGVSAQAIVWLPGGGSCLLGSGRAHGLTEVNDGTVLVSGTVDSGVVEAVLAMVWEVNLTACTSTEWPLYPSDFGWSEAGDDVAFDVRATAEGWEAAGMSADAPVVWTWDGQEVVGTKLADDLKTRRINQAGEIVGRSKVKGVWRGILWTPSQP
jgi:hypothetical protein